ncbi:MAG: glycosyltransferase family 1 protein [Pirellulaceae bacterium]|nr:glycosyltransferase family 1 protein [Pirellulaceae bacterium]HJN11788.1 glycosyltransferase family 1 protein [Pirellulaceae bacterium]
MKSLPPARRILFDCSAQSRSKAFRGIPRVVQSILRHAPDVAKERGGSVIPISYAFGGWSEKSLADNDESAPARRDRALLTSLLEQLCGVVPSHRLRRLLLPPPGRDGVWKFTRLRQGNALRLYHRLTHRSTSPGNGDVLVLFDLWLRAPNSFWSNVAKARRRGAKIVTVVYDLIPITHPHFVGPKHNSRFRKWIHQVAVHSDCFVAISETVKSELQEYLKITETHQEWSDDRFFSFMLGSEICDTSGLPVREKVAAAFKSGSTYLMVGALEPRKNQGFLLDAFDRLWQRNSDAKLCLVGVETRAVPELLERLRHHPQRDSRLFYFPDLNDVELNYCYQHTCAVVYPSIVEGFGLPIIEALHHGKAVFASDTRIHREVGRHFCEYFDLGCSTSLTNMIAEHQSQLDVGNTRPTIVFKSPTWNESCREMLDICLRRPPGFVLERQKAGRAA